MEEQEPAAYPYPAPDMQDGGAVEQPAAAAENLDPEGAGGASHMDMQPGVDMRHAYDQCYQAQGEQAGEAQAASEQQQEQQPAVDELQALQQQRQQYADWFRQYVAAHAGLSSTEADNNSSSSDSSLEAYAALSIPQLVGEMHKASSAYTYLSQLKYWAECVREVERVLRGLGLGGSAAADSNVLPTPSSNLDGYKEAVLAAIQALSGALYAAQLAAYYASAAEGLPALASAASAIDARMQQCRYQLYSRLNNDAADLLAACSWPPSLAATPAAAGKAATSAGGAVAGPLPNGHASAGGFQEDATNNQQPAQLGQPGSWPQQQGGSRGGAAAATAQGQDDASLNNQQPAFSGADGSHGGGGFVGFSTDPQRQEQLLAVLACLTRLQVACEAQAFSAAQEQQQAVADGAGGEAPGAGSSGAASHADAEALPVLWAASVLAAPLQARLQAHFQPHTPAGRLEQPRWLFQLVLRLLQQHLAAVAGLQPALDAAGLAGRCHISLEWARAMRDACKAVLRTARLPALVELWESQGSEEGKQQAAGVWRAYVEAMLEFDRQLAPYLGGPANLQAGSPLPDALLPGSVVGSITQEAGFMEVWLQVQRTTALADLEHAAAQPTAWQLAPAGDAAADSALANGSSSGTAREFAPPEVAQVVHARVVELVALSQHMPTADDQRAVLDQVGGALLTRTAELLAAALEQAGAYQGLTSAEAAPTTGACVSAARYLHHMVSELLVGPALHRLHSPAGRAAAVPAAAGSAPAGAGSSPGPTPSPGGGGAPSSPSPARSVLGYRLLSPPPEGPSPLRGLLGDVVVQHSFTPAAWDPPVLAAAVAHLGAQHREWCLRIARELALNFGKGAATYRQYVQECGQYPTHPGAAGTPLPALLPALTGLQAGLAVLAGPLDGPSFRDIWRAVAVPINRLLFNHLATEVTFTSAGAQQFAVDCAAITAVFAPYTKRPGAHFREALAAVRLLALADEPTTVEGVVRTASELAVAGTPLHRHPGLAELGLGCLTPAQLLAVLERRL